MITRLAGTTRFGATRDEAAMPLPGDEIVPTPLLELTHGITIEAPPERIWPWLAQIGQGRAGFYSDAPWWDACVDLYYRLLAREQRRPRERYLHADDAIVPAWQDLAAGTPIADGPPGTARYVVRLIEPDRCLVLFTDTHLPHTVPAGLRERVTGELTAAYLLQPLGGGATRVLRRMRMTCDPVAFRLLALPLVLGWGELITARNFLRGLKRRAEGTGTSGTGTSGTGTSGTGTSGTGTSGAGPGTP